MHIDHINISAPKSLLEKEKQFFCDVFCLHEGFRPRLSRKGYWLYSGDKPIIHLSESNDHFANEKKGYFDHVAFQTSGLKDLIKTLNKMAIKYSTGSLPEIGMTQVFFKAPSETGIEANFIDESI